MEITLFIPCGFPHWSLNSMRAESYLSYSMRWPQHWNRTWDMELFAVCVWS